MKNQHDFRMWFHPVRLLCIGLFLQLVFSSPQPSLAAPPTAASPSLDTMIGQMVMVGFRGLYISPTDPIAADIKKGRVGGVILFNRDVKRKSNYRNIIRPQQVERLITSLKSLAPTPIFIAVDQEGGRVNRLKKRYGFQTTVSAQSLGELDMPKWTLHTGAVVGHTLARVGFNVDFAPVVDVNVNPQSPAIGAIGRSFSSDPEKTAIHAAAFIQGLHESGVLSCIKHFPGHGSAQNDTHKGITDVSNTWTRDELIPYQYLADHNLIDMVMSAHVVNSHLDPVYPASLSKAIITSLLRETIGFQGVVVSDDLQMGAITKQYSLTETINLAIDAGVDILLFGNNLEYNPDLPSIVADVLKKRVQDGTLSRERIQASYDRIQALKAKLIQLEQTACYPDK
ncbi:beta-N-acetylhexosaminidase [Desulfovibrio inopinatus]|uniref:beta-N-acetylhexosaminidase n=1 Tax=Desulfovibrio inopinatus TaxID=102109 RepID=UPI001FE0213B|nr:beta-N-acetylhexosaminidase [Desulfovibrio inopinatus]